MPEILSLPPKNSCCRLIPGKINKLICFQNLNFKQFTVFILLFYILSDCTRIQNIVRNKDLIGHPLKLKGNELKIQNRCNTIISALIKHIDIRYKDLINDDVLESTLIGSFRNWPCEMKSGMFHLCFITLNFHKHIVNIYSLIIF